jgi:hypothetical protein
MLVARTGLADVRLDFKFAGVSERYTVTMGVNIDNTDTIVNSVMVHELLSNEQTIKIGNVPKKVLTIDLVSNDRLLISSNKDSKYYGLMNNTCVIYIYVREHGSDIDWSQCAFGKFFVTSWRPKSTTEDNKSVSIEAVDRMGALVKSPIPTLSLYKGYTLEWYVNSVCGYISDRSEDELKFGVNLPLGKYNTASDMCLKANNVGELLNDVSLSSMNFIIFDRENDLKSIYYNTSAEPVDVKAKLTDRDVVISGILDTSKSMYSKLSVKFSGTTVSDERVICSVTDYAIKTSADNSSYTTVNFPNLSGAVYKVSGVKLRYLNEDVSDVEVRDVYYDRNSVTVRLLNWSSNVQSVDIEVIGQIIEEYELEDVFTIGDGETTLNVNNKLGNVETVTTYGEELCEVLKNRTESLELTGSFNIQLKPGDVIEVELETLDVHGLFMIMDASWTFDGGVSCVLKLDSIKEIDSDNNEV